MAIIRNIINLTTREEEEEEGEEEGEEEEEEDKREEQRYRESVCVKKIEREQGGTGGR